MRRSGVRWVGGVVSLLAAVSLTGCSSGSGTTSSPASAAGGGAPSAPAAAGGASVSAPAPAPATPPSAGAAGGPVTACSMIDLAAATALLGGTPKQLSSAVPVDAGATKIDGCSYSSSEGTLGYDVNQFATNTSLYITTAKSRMSQMGSVKTFDVGLGDDSLGYLISAGAKTAARLEISKGNLLIAVSSSSSDATKAQSIAMEAAKKLLGAAG